MSNTSPSPEQIQKLIDLGIYKKTKDGKRLTRDEETRLKELKAGGKKVRPKVECYDSMTSASAGLGIAVELLQQAKTLGCPGFRGSRIYAEELRQWLQENPVDESGDDSLVGLKKQFLKSQIRKSDFQLETLKGLHVPLDEVRQNITVLVSELNCAIRRIEDGLPQALAGLDLPSQRLKIREFFDKLRATIHKGGQEVIT